MKNIIKCLVETNKQACLCLAVFFGATITGSGAALAQSVTYPSELNVPYGRSYMDENTPYRPSSRSANGNRLIINGRILSGDGTTLSGGLDDGFFGSQSQFGSGGASAIGNQLNVITNGNWNTVIIDSTQINNGDQTVNSDELNGEIDLND